MSATSEFYMKQATQNEQEAAGANLDNVRERHLVARDTWNDMADKAESVITTRAKAEAEKQAMQQANMLLVQDAAHA